MNLLGIDFEEWYHPELVSKFVSQEKKKPLILEGLDKILDWLRTNDTYATFFVVGELLEYDISVFDKIIASGNEIGFHTMHHTRLDSNNFKNQFGDEVDKFSKLTKGKSRGFRAPTFSLNEKSSWFLDILVEKNYLYDSSIVPAKTSMYGVPKASVRPYRISSNNIEENDPNGKILEFPLLVTNFLGRRIPAGGGFYLRFLPMRTIKKAISEYENKDIPATFYIHSWELVPEYFPSVNLPIKNKFITYYNLGKALPRMSEILKEFDFISFEKFINK